MPQLTRNWYFEPWPVGGGGARDEAADAEPRLTCVPPSVLQRHGARLLDPGAAPTIPHEEGAPESWARTPQSTVYRARTLLIPADLLADTAIVKAINTALASVGMRIVPPDLERPQLQSTGRTAEVLRRLPRVAVLVPTAEPGKPPLPVTVDAWTALQALRAAASTVGKGSTADENSSTAIGGALLSTEVVRRIALEHLLVGSAITGSPSSEGNGISGSPSSEGNGLAGPGSTDSYSYSGGDTRAPVTVCLPAPARREDCGSRRPVVAVLDTGIRAHPWLDVRPDKADRYVTDRPGGFVQVDPDIQNGIQAVSESAAALGYSPRVPIKEPWETPVSGDRLVGELNDATGHGTFIAGIVRQAAADAQVLAIRIMHSDDVVYEGDLLAGLALLADRIAVAQAGDMTRMVDVVSLSLGYFDESAADISYSSGLWQIIELFLEMGVAVVAAAGNFATSRRFYPAAFTLRAPLGPVPVISVGALNPNGSRALFSDGGRWVWAWAKGAAVVSTFPDDINGSRTPEVRTHPHPDNELPPEGRLPAEREALDPDNYHGGFAVWSGTSFSAPLIAAQLATQLLKNTADPALGFGLDQPGAPAAANRVAAARAALGAHPATHEPG